MGKPNALDSCHLARHVAHRQHKAGQSPKVAAGKAREARGWRIGRHKAAKAQIGLAQRSSSRDRRLPDRPSLARARVKACRNWHRGQVEPRHVARAQPARRLGQGQIIGALHKVKNVPMPAATETMGEPRSILALIDGEAGGTVGMEGATGHPFAASLAQRHNLARHLWQGIVAPDGGNVDHCPPPNAIAASITATSGRTA